VEREVGGAGRHEAFHAMLDRSAAVYLGRRVVAGAQKAPTLMSRGLRSVLVGDEGFEPRKNRQMGSVSTTRQNSRCVVSEYGASVRPRSYVFAPDVNA